MEFFIILMISLVYMNCAFLHFYLKSFPICLKVRQNIKNKYLNPEFIICMSQDSDADINWDPRSGPKLDFEEDYYAVLEVPPTISAQDLKKAYYKIVFEYHPDRKKNPTDKILCNKQMMVINNAYKTLKEPTLRREYDTKRRAKQFANKADKRDTWIRASDNTDAKNSRESPHENVYDFNRDAFYNSLRDNRNVLEDEDDLYAQAVRYFNNDADGRDISSQKGDSTRGSKANRISRIMARIDAVEKALRALDAVLDADSTDWGEVRDIRQLEARFRSVDDRRRLQDVLTDLLGELDYQNWQQKQQQMRQGPGRVQAWDESLEAGIADIWDELIGVNNDNNTGGDQNVFREVFRDGFSSGADYDTDGVPLWRKEQAERRRACRQGQSGSGSNGGSGRSGDDVVIDELQRLRDITRKR